MKRIVLILALFLSIVLFLSCSKQAEHPKQDQCIRYLFEQAENENNSYWNRIHAIEYLNELGFKKELQNLLQNDTSLATNRPQQRIGYLRCLVETAPSFKERTRLIRKILSIYLDENTPDKIHAAETLAKLRVSLNGLHPHNKKLSASDSVQLAAYVNWGKIYFNDNPDSLDYHRIFSTLQAGTDVEKQIMAYGLAYVGNFNETSWLQLLKNTDSFRNQSFFPAILHGLVTTCPDQIKYKTQIDSIKNQLKPFLYAQDKAAVVHALTGLSAIQTFNDTNLIRNVHDSTCFSLDKWKDIQSAKAFSIEKIKLRQSQAKTRFSWLDWCIVILILLSMLYVGYTTSKTNKTQKDYVLGGKGLNSKMVGISLFATLFSTLSYLAFPGEMIKYGPIYFTNILSFPFATWIVGKYLIPKFVSMNVTSAYEILEIKLGKGTRILGNIFFLALRFLWMSTIIYATVDTALVPILGISLGMVPFISFTLVLITVIYTTMGGLKAVVITDVMQSAIMFLGVILVIGVIFVKIGSIDEFLNPQLYAHWNKMDFSLDPTKRMTVANIFLMTLVWQVCTSGSDQMAIQRYLSVKDSKTATHSYAISLASSAVIQLLLALVGLMVMVYFSHFPEQMAPGATITKDADTLFPRFILIGLPVGLTGLIASAIMAAAMSSLSSGLNSSSTVILEDIVKKHTTKDVSSLKMIKVISALLGLAVSFSCLLIGYVTGNLLDIVIKVVNLVVAPLFVLFFMALFVPFATNRATIVGGIVSLITAILIAFFNIFGITVTWIMPCALVVGIAVSTLGSWIERKLKF